MKLRAWTMFTVATLFAGHLLAGESNKKVEDFTLEDCEGIKHSLSDYKDSKAIVLIFVSVQCPVSNAYNSRMVHLYKDYTPRNVAFIGLNSNKTESVAEVKEHAKKQGFQFPILKDVNNVIADRLEASFTPEIYVLNSKLEPVYHGRIDDSQRESNISSRDLRSALDEILADKPVSMASTKAFGCTIKRVSKQ